MVESLPTANDIIALVKKLMASRGPEAFKTNGPVQLYSGPREIIRRALLSFAKNRKRAFAQAEYSLTTPIDNTEAGQFLGKLDGIGIFKFFEKVYSVDTPEAFAHADAVMRFTSSEFIKAASGHVETAVCGDDLTKIFFEVELPELIKNERIDTINNVPTARIRQIYFAQGAYVAFREICRAEIEMARERVALENTPETRLDLKARLKFFKLECKETAELFRSYWKDTISEVSTLCSNLWQNDPVRAVEMGLKRPTPVIQLH